MIERQHKGIKWFEFRILQKFKNIKHGVISKETANNSLLDLNVNLKDTSAEVLANLERVKTTFNLSKIIWAQQLHETKVIPITNQNTHDVFECDGFITNQLDTTLLIKHADCQAALFYDPTKQVIANVHCGWRGNVLNIYKETVNQLKTLYQCKPHDLIVCISPSLGPNHAEFKKYKDEFPKEFWPFQVRANYFNLWSIAVHQLKQLGILEKNIEVAKVCTYENQGNFFSYRREKETQRNASIISLCNQCPIDN